MIIIDKPYVSEFLISTVRKNNFPVLRNDTSVDRLGNNYPNLLDVEDAVEIFKKDPDHKLYTVSENSIGWILDHLQFTAYPEKISMFKNKVTFRKITRENSPGLFFREVGIHELGDIDYSSLPKPLILKPAVGFFSLGVKQIGSRQEWEDGIRAIGNEVKSLKGMYPDKVLDLNSFIIEGFIYGDEYAFDAYFDHNGDPVILGILKHEFSSESDVGDRLYITSEKIISGNLERFTGYLRSVGELTGLKNMPLHTEVRVNGRGELIPIEINPMRFGAWCTTADTTWFAYGLNPYEYYFSGKRPDWEKYLKNKTGRTYSMIVLNNSTGLDPERIHSFKYTELLSHFSNPLELRKIDHRKYNVFGFLFTETPEKKRSELDWILHSDLKEFID